MLDEVVVTGTGTEHLLKDVPVQTEVINHKIIEGYGGKNLQDILMMLTSSLDFNQDDMGSQMQLNGLGNNYILILIDGKRIHGDVGGQNDLGLIDPNNIDKIEIVKGASSALYGSDAIAGVINIITSQPTSSLCSVTTATTVSGDQQLTQAATVDIYKNGLGSYTSLTHDQADSYRNNPLELVKGSDTETQQSIAPLFTGYQADVLAQKFTYSPSQHLAMNVGLDYSYKMTDRPETHPELSGGTDYEMRYKGLRLTSGFIYKFDAKNSLQVDYTIDRYRYGKEYDVATSSYAVGDYVQSKKQRSIERQVKAILAIVPQGTTIVGNDWQLDKLVATSGNINQEAYTLAYYAQHEQHVSLGRQTTLSATLGLRYNYHKTFGNRLTPKATLMLSRGALNLRATYSAGFRAPGLDELYYHYFSVNRGKPQISFGNQGLKPEKSNYLSLNAEYRSTTLAASLTGYINNISDMVVKQNIDVDDDSRAMLVAQFPEMTAEQAGKLVSYARYQNSDKGSVKGLQFNLSVNILRGFNLSANYAYTYARSKSAGESDEWQPLERSIRHTATVAANYHRSWSHYALNVNLSGRLQSKTYYTGSYEDAPGFGIWSLHTTHTITLHRLSLEPSLGVDNIFDRVDRRIDTATRRYALYSPGRMLVAGLKISFK